MSKQMKKMLLIAGIVFGLIFGFYGIKKIFFAWIMGHYTPPPVTVMSSKATAKTWQSYVSAVGTLTAVNGVDISAEVAGTVTEIRFTSGQFVNKDDVLVLLDTSVEQAQLKDQQAKLKLAKINYDRDQILLKRNVVSQAAADTTLAQYEEAQAGVEEIQARINQKTITAPFNGKIGIREIDLGQFVPAGTNMVALQSLDPLYVRFNLPEQYLPELHLQQPVDIEVNLSGSKTVRGTITAINSKVDQNTRNILVQATLPNKDMALYPGMFALIKVWLHAKNNLVVLPQTAISYSLHGDSVFIIKKEGKDDDDKPILKAYRQYVTVGERREGEIAILKGIKPGDEIVAFGQLKLQNGTHVVIDNTVR